MHGHTVRHLYQALLSSRYCRLRLAHPAKTLAFKCMLFPIALLSLSEFASIALVRHLGDRLDPRARILYETSFSQYRVVLLGTSVFGSNYVDREDQALWRIFERETDIATLPVTLSGARPGDLVAHARYLAPRLTAGTTVFIEARPLNMWDRRKASHRDRLSHGGYFFDDPDSLQCLWNKVGQPLIAGLFRSRELIRSRPRESYFGITPNFNRVWDKDGDYAINRYRDTQRVFEAGMIEPEIDFSTIEMIHNLLKQQRLHPVFVITPYNNHLTARYATPTSTLESFLERQHHRLSEFLRARRFEFIDLRDALPSNGFADLIHPNAVGEDLFARALVAYVTRDRLAKPTARGSPASVMH